MNTGNYIEATLDTINDGRVKQSIDEQIGRAVKELDRHEQKYDDLTGKVKLSIDIEIARNAKTEEFMDFDVSTKLTLPKPPKKSALVRAGKGRLLVEIGGSPSLNDNDQMTLPTFDRFGALAGKVNPQTGEAIDDEDDPVAGKVGSGA